MAGLPELNGVYGTFSGTRGLNLTPLQMKQRQQMFLAQLAQEQQAQAAQQAAQTRGLDLQQRGQDLATKENELARTFQQNLMGQRQTFESEQRKAAEEAAVAAQQRAIQESQRAQGAGQQFQREEGAAQREFQGQQADMDRTMQAQVMAQRKAEFEKTFGLESDKFDFMREIQLKDEGRKDRAEQLNTELRDLQVALTRGEINQRQAQTAMILKQTEALGMELREALEDQGLSDDDYGKIAAGLSTGDLPGNLAAKLMKSPKAAKAVANLMQLMQSAQEMGLRGAQKEGIEAETKLTKLKGQAVEGELNKPAEAEAAAGPTNDEGGAIIDLQRRAEKGDLGGIGKARLAALQEIQGLGGRTDATTDARRQKLRAFAELSEAYEKADFTNLTPSALGAIGLAGTALEALRLMGQGIARMSEDDKETALREMAADLGLETDDFFPG